MTQTPPLAPQLAAPRPFTGRHMLAITVSFFAVVIGVNITMAVISGTSWTGLVVDNSYVASQEYQDKLDAHRVQVAAGWVSTFDYDGSRIRLELVSNGAPVVINGLQIRLNRPIGTHDDKLLDLVLQPDGSHVADVVLGDGMWEALISAPETALGPFELHKRFKVEAGS
jgi:nitrogen fixation protein FixH